MISWFNFHYRGEQNSILNGVYKIILSVTFISKCFAYMYVLDSTQGILLELKAERRRTVTMDKTIYCDIDEDFSIHDNIITRACLTYDGMHNSGR